MLDRQRRLDQTADAGCGFRMPDVRLQRAKNALSIRRPRRRQHSSQRLYFNRISQTRSGPVSLHILNIARRHIGAAAGLSKHCFLCLAIRRHDSVAASIVIDGASFDDGDHRISIPNGIREKLQNNHTRTIAAHDSIGILIERSASAFRGEGAGTREEHVALRHQVDVHAACHGQRAFAFAQTLAGEMDRDQRTRTRGIERETGAVKIQKIRKAIRDDAVRGTGSGVRIRSAQIVEQQGS